MRGERAVVSHKRPFGWLLAYDFPFREVPFHSRGSGRMASAVGVSGRPAAPGDPLSFIDLGEARTALKTGRARAGNALLPPGSR